MIDTTENTQKEPLVSELMFAGAKFKGNSCTCPFHPDRHASASVYEENGVWRFKCHTTDCGFGGDVFDVRAKVDRKPLATVLKRKEETPAVKPKRVFPTVDSIRQSVSKMGPVEAVYEYSNPDTKAVEVVQVRYAKEPGEKSFLVHHAVDGGFVLGAPPKPWPIYNRARIRNAPFVVVVEGEKCVHALHSVGIVATTSMSGADNADKADWTPLAGKKVYLWRDFDDAGSAYVSTIAEILQKLTPAPEVWNFDPTGLGLDKGGDVADYIADGATAEDIRMLLNDGSEPLTPGSEFLARIQDIESGKWRSLDWPFNDLSRFAKSLFPGTITVLCGDPGTSKSFFLLQSMHTWHSAGHKVSLFELEEDRAFHLHRLFAIVSENWDVMDDGWCRTHPGEMRQIKNDFAPMVEDFAPRLSTAPLGEVRYAEVLEWMEAECKAGAEILGIDPITAVETGEGRHREDLSFIVKASKLLRKYGARLILITHPRSASSKGGKSMDDLAGGRAFSRNTQTVLWLHRHDPAKVFKIDRRVGVDCIECNRSIAIVKARNGRGHGFRIAYIQTHGVKFAEQGVVMEES